MVGILVFKKNSSSVEAQVQRLRQELLRYSCSVRRTNHWLHVGFNEMQIKYKCSRASGKHLRLEKVYPRKTYEVQVKSDI